MKNCKVCSSMAFNLAREGIDQGDLCDRHYWQDRAEKAEASVAMLRAGDTCARHCEGTAYRIEARRLKRWSDELRLALSGERKDAARYRWIRLGRADIEADGEFVLMTTLFDQFHTSSPSELDSAIDAAIAKDAQ